MFVLCLERNAGRLNTAVSDDDQLLLTDDVSVPPRSKEQIMDDATAHVDNNQSTPLAFRLYKNECVQINIESCALNKMMPERCR